MKSIIFQILCRILSCPIEKKNITVHFGYFYNLLQQMSDRTKRIFKLFLYTSVNYFYMSLFYFFCTVIICETQRRSQDLLMYVCVCRGRGIIIIHKKSNFVFLHILKVDFSKYLTCKNWRNGKSKKLKKNVFNFFTASYKEPIPKSSEQNKRKITKSSSSNNTCTFLLLLLALFSIFKSKKTNCQRVALLFSLN